MKKQSSALRAFLYCSVCILTVIFSVSATAYLNTDKNAEPVLNVITPNTDAENNVEAAKIFGKFSGKENDKKALSDILLIPCGDVFGVKFFTKGVIIIGTADIETDNGYINPAEKAGLMKNDIIVKVNGSDINTVEELASVVEKSNGSILFVEYTRDGKSSSLELTPVLSASDSKYKTGIWVRDSTAGIGTITYYNPENNSFAGLGHGICDVETGKLMPLLRGTIVDVSISDIIKGKYGTPGELKGTFDTRKKGTLIGNTEAGVFGILDNAPNTVYDAVKIMPRSEVESGKATILVNPDGKGIMEYDVMLSKIDRQSDGTKSFSIEVTDPRLLSITGGIVQGMSGSPILQNGKLAGAVTHVLVNDPTKGYGIFIENMLARMPEIAK